ncbi:maleate cis-trans isomerase family protein [Yoonia sediminilitoris]|uniref:Maleate isomerase n=1 Tax=Yoonia sediminilitoris TaxID=1286148 RepID=A0A2T6KMK5_9RHOB|nr:aspartate/glutamate racemase family protein [Yoonia sediminilitoris]PUB17453.1 maleate isomerase [Yoonia sediminilitoris]RCW97748.1 maleate isomerase [Yoonia sediminilitoris]
MTTFERLTGKRVGMLTPSSNTVLEPYTSAMFAPFGDAASAHFGRFRVVEISMSDASQGQFTDAPILEAAKSLAEAEVDLIAWNGTSASWLGLEKDRALCAMITAETGIKTTSTSLAYDRLFAGIGLKTLGLVTPYLSEVQERIITQYATQGIAVTADARLEEKVNHAFGTYSTAQIAKMIRDVAQSRPDAISILCTNFRGAPHAAALEAEIGIPVFDSVSVTAAHCMCELGLDPTRVTEWGSVFQRFAQLPQPSQQREKP